MFWRSAIVLSLLLSVAFPSGSATYTVVGSSTMNPLVVALARRFETLRPGMTVRIVSDGTTNGIAAVANGKADFAAVTRSVRPEERAVLRRRFNSDGYVYRVAVEGISIFLHPKNDVSRLTVSQVVGIFSGSIRNWKDVGGVDAPIQVCSFDETTGRYGYFVDEVMQKRPITSRARRTGLQVNVVPAAERLKLKQQQMLTWVSSDPHAIGYGDLGRERIVKIAGIGEDGREVWPTPEALQSGRYPFARTLSLLFATPPEGALLEFASWAARQEDLIRAAGFAPLPKPRRH